SPAKVDRWAATAVLRTSWSPAPAPVAWLPPPAVRLAPEWGQVVACWARPGREAGPPHRKIGPSSAAPLWGACWGSIDDRLRGPLRRRPQSDTRRSAGRGGGGGAASPSGSP